MPRETFTDPGFIQDVHNVFSLKSRFHLYKVFSKEDRLKRGQENTNSRRRERETKAKEKKGREGREGEVELLTPSTLLTTPPKLIFCL